MHYGQRDWPGAQLEPLFAERATVVTSPRLCRRAGLRAPAQLLDVQLLHLRSRPHAWPEWFQAARLAEQAATELPASQRGPRFEHFSMVIQAAIASLGAAVVPTFLVRAQLADGSLVEPFPEHAFVTGRDYWLAYPDRTAALPAFAAFRSWLTAQIAARS